MAGDPGGARGAIAPPEKIVRGRTLAFAPPEIQVSVKFAPATQIEDPSIICDCEKICKKNFACGGLSLPHKPINFYFIHYSINDFLATVTNSVKKQFLLLQAFFASLFQIRLR